MVNIASYISYAGKRHIQLLLNGTEKWDLYPGFLFPIYKELWLIFFFFVCDYWNSSWFPEWLLWWGFSVVVFIQSMLIFLLTGVNGELSYYLPPGLAEDRFLLDSSTGQLSTTVSLDREEQASYTLTGNSYT